MDVSIRELKNRLSEYLRRVRAGEQVTVTLRGKRIARLSSVTDSNEIKNPAAEAIERLNAQPWMIKPRRKGKPKGSDRPVPSKPGDKTAEEIVREIRD